MLALFAILTCSGQHPFNDGLKPTRLHAYGKTHLYQIPPKPKGTAVSTAAAAAAWARFGRLRCLRQPLEP